MHRLNVLVYASNSFISTLDELRPFLKFNHFTTAPNTGYDIILYHDEVLKVMLPKLNIMPCWLKRGYWSQSTDMPTNVRDVVIERVDLTK